MAKAKFKPLYFTTTMRNPERIPKFLSCLLPFEGQILSNDLISQIVKNVINEKLYSTNYISGNKYYHSVYKDEESKFNESELDDILTNSPQDHKEAGFDKGWASRFDTWYKISKELGFLNYSIGSSIELTQTGHMLVDAFKEESVNESKIQKIFLNAMAKYQRDNPYRKVLNKNKPLILLLQVIKLLNQDKSQNGAGVFIQEIPFFLCWQDDNYENLYKFIIKFRKEHKFQYGSEIVYEECLKLLQSNNRKLFKYSQICTELVDDYIRKMRMTGVVSLRGNGRFIDINSVQAETVEYILENYSKYTDFTDLSSYLDYMGKIDSSLLSIDSTSKIDLSSIKKKALKLYAQNNSPEFVKKELLALSGKKESKDQFLKFISRPTRLEFLTSVALVQMFDNLDVNPNYSVDDEGMPTFTAAGGLADIDCFDEKTNTLFEVTLMTGRSDQINNEMIPIVRHLKEAKDLNRRPTCFSVFVAPKVHSDVFEFIDWQKFKEKLDIKAYSINDFIKSIEKVEKVIELIQN